MAPQNPKSLASLHLSQPLMNTDSGSNAASPAKAMSREALVMKPGSTVSFRDAGYPGYLTDEEFFIFVSSSICFILSTYDILHAFVCGICPLRVCEIRMLQKPYVIEFIRITNSSSD